MKKQARPTTKQLLMFPKLHLNKLVGVGWKLPSLEPEPDTGTRPGPGPGRGDTPGRRVVYLNLPAVPGAITVDLDHDLDASALRLNYLYFPLHERST